MQISTRLILFLVSAVIAVMTVYALATISRTQNQMDEEMVKMADHLGMALSVGVLHHLEENDRHGVVDVIESMERYDDVAGVAVYDKDGRLVAASGIDSVEGAEPTTTGTSQFHVQQIINTKGESAGWLRLAITGHSLQDHVVQARNHILLTILCLTMVISASIIYFSRRHLAGPLAQLTERAQAIGRGDLSRRIEVEGDDEIAVLAQAFNQMAADLQESARQIIGEREYIRSVVDSMAEGIVVVDGSQRITAWNRTMADRHGINAGQAQGQALAAVLPGLATTGYLSELAQMLAGRSQAAERSLVSLPEDVDRTLTVTASPLRHSPGRIDGAVIVLADTTERMRLEQQVQRSDKLAAVGQLAAGIAHEIGTPLNVISGTAEFLRGEHKDVEELQTIVEEVRRITDLVQRLMSFARHEEPKMEPVDLVVVVHKVLSLMKHQMERKGIEVVADIDTALPAIAADHGKLQQVLVNLLLNGWQAMPEGGQLRISARSAASGSPDDGVGEPESVIVQITDTGDGIADDILSRVFEPFFTTKDVGEGTGLGLAIVQRIVEDHSGRLDLRSKPGTGTTVELTFPACTQEVTTHD